MQGTQVNTFRQAIVLCDMTVDKDDNNDTRFCERIGQYKILTTLHPFVLTIIMKGFFEFANIDGGGTAAVVQYLQRHGLLSSHVHNAPCGWPYTQSGNRGRSSASP